MILERVHSIYDFADYEEFSKGFKDKYPEWFTTSLTLIDLEKCCRYCGKPVPAMREYLCSDFCNMYFKYAAHDTKVNSLRRFMHKCFRFECSACGSRLAYEVPSGLVLPVYSGEVDHIIALKDGGKHLISNMQLLCIGCHMRKTLSQR